MNRKELNRINDLVETLTIVDAFLTLNISIFNISNRGCIVERNLSIPRQYICTSLVEYKDDLKKELKSLGYEFGGE